MPTRIYLVRHGETDLTAEDRFAGSTNVPLSADGRSQVKALAERLRGDTLDGIYASDMDRTMETAAIIAEPHRCEVQSEPGLREIAYGHWEERTRDEIERDFSDEFDAWQEDPLTVGPEGGESGIYRCWRVRYQSYGVTSRTAYRAHTSSPFGSGSSAQGY